jgi:Mn-containing catalase
MEVEKNAADESELLSLMLDGKAAKENYIHEAMINPQFFLVGAFTNPYR